MGGGGGSRVSCQLQFVRILLGEFCLSSLQFSGVLCNTSRLAGKVFLQAGFVLPLLTGIMARDV